jgi:hypothetical protein
VSNLTSLRGYGFDPREDIARCSGEDESPVNGQQVLGGMDFFWPTLQQSIPIPTGMTWRRASATSIYHAVETPVAHVVS